MDKLIKELTKTMEIIARREIAKAHHPDIKDVYNMMAMIGVAARKDEVFRQDVSSFIREILGECEE